MVAANKSYLVVNVLYWVVAALLQPLASLLPAGSGEPPKVLTLLIPLAFVGLAFGSTVLMARAVASQGGENCAGKSVN